MNKFLHYLGLLALSLAVLTLVACGPAETVCVESHTEEAPMEDFATAYVVTGSVARATVLSQDQIVCDRWEPIAPE